MLDPPSGFIDNIKSIIRSFVWNNKKPKLKYNTIIGDYFQGGLKVPDLYCRIKTQRIMWVKRIITQLQGPATELLNLKLKYLGGLHCIGSNFDIKQIPNTIPDFYITCLKIWADFTASKPDNYKEIIEQPVWNNRYININDKSIYYEDIRNLGVIYMKDIIKADGGIKQIEDFNIPRNKKIASYFLKWASLRDAKPKSWKRILKDYASNKNIELSGTKAYIVVNGNVKQICMIKAKYVYQIFIKNILVVAPAQSKYEKLLSLNINWPLVYESIYKSTIYNYLREFQYKITNNYLAVNYKLHKWKIVYSGRCAYCFLYQETINHLFNDCLVSRSFYYKFTEWVKTCGIEMPDLSSFIGIFGILPISKDNAIQNHLILLWKFILFSNRDKANLDLFQIYKAKITCRSVYKIE